MKGNDHLLGHADRFDCAETNMMSPIYRLAKKLLPAAYLAYQRAPEPGTKYIDRVASRTDLPTYLKEVARFAAEPRSDELWQRYHDDVFDIDAEIIMQAGLDWLCSHAELTQDERGVIERIAEFQTWETGISHERLNNAYLRGGDAAIDDVASRLLGAAYERFGRPPEAGGIYIATVARSCDVRGYFRMMTQLAREPRTRDLWERYNNCLRDSDAEMVMEAGLKHLLKSQAMPKAGRAAISDILSFLEWEIEVRAELDDEANRQAGREAGWE
jgi:hypothetical protein